MTQGVVVSNLRAPFPYFGGKRWCAPLVWQALGARDCRLYCEPFGGSLANLLARPAFPDQRYTELVNDIDGALVNVWRSIQLRPEEVERHLPGPPALIEAKARLAWLRAQDWTEQLLADPSWCDPRGAAWWLYCKAVMIRDSGLHLGSFGRGIYSTKTSTLDVLTDRLTNVRIHHAGWQTLVTPAALRPGQEVICGVVLDPPYHTQHRPMYAEEGAGISQNVAEWCREHGSDPRLRIVFHGYEGAWAPPPGWTVYSYEKGEGHQQTPKPERIWFSPACLPVDGSKHLDGSSAAPQLGMFS